MHPGGTVLVKAVIPNKNLNNLKVLSPEFLYLLASNAVPGLQGKPM
jgi:hypothetical protein